MKKFCYLFLIVCAALHAERAKKPFVETKLVGHLAAIKSQMQSMKKIMEQAAPATLPVAIGTLPYTIREPGIYYFPNNLVFSGKGPAITVAANNVVINCYNNALTVAEGIGILVSGVREFTLQNGVIQGNVVGMQIENATAVHLLNSFFNGSKVTIDGASGVTLDTVSCDDSLLTINGSSQHITLTNCTINGQITATEVSGMQISDSLIEGAVTVGANNLQIQNSAFINGALLFTNGSGALLEEVIFDSVEINQYDSIMATNCMSRGLHIIQGSYCSFIDCHFANAAQANVQLDNATGCLFSGCKIIDSQADGIVFTTGSSQNALINCEVSNNGQNGCTIMIGATDNQLLNNNVYANANYGIYNLEPTTNCLFNVSCNNKGADCPGSGVHPEQAPGVSSLVPGSNICCIP